MTESDYGAREEKAVAAIKKAIPASLKRDMHPLSKGMFCELYENDEVFPNHFLATAIDGVGTKVVLAEAMRKYDTIGIDLVAMSANDLATFGKMSPFMFIDYLAVEHKVEEEALTGDIIKGMVKGLEQCEASGIFRNSVRVHFGKGETASVDELMSGISEGYGFDLAGGMIGFVPKKDFGFKVKPGQKIIALPSSGLHSNGYTDARLKLLKGEFETREKFRKRYTGKYKLDDAFEGSTIGETLLAPTKIYVQQMAKISKEFNVQGANNTGYGLKNLNRITGKFEFNITNPLTPQPIFKLLQKEGKFTKQQMYTKFNMGMGFFVICEKEDADDILQVAKEGAIVGEVSAAPSTKVVMGGMDFVGY
ncbi:MAG: AIR synthase-related protein [Nanoarchaeota archaeon]|nr:AIR synthase-related protein [Nanoarchaeota archaeon]